MKKSNAKFDPKVEQKTICVDFDGVLAHHESDWGVAKIGDPLPEGLQLVHKMQGQGYKVVILTARNAKQHKEIEQWLGKNGISKVEVTNVKPPAEAYYDDRAVQVPRNWGHK